MCRGIFVAIFCRATIADAVPLRRISGTAGRIIRQLIEHIGPDTELIGSEEREWASATFSGARHSVHLRMALPDAAAAAPTGITALPDHEFDLSRDIVADCTATLGQRHRDAQGQWWLPLIVEILTVTAD